MGNAECGIVKQGRSRPEASPDIPHSALRIPHFLAGGLLLALATPPAGAQQPDSVPRDTTTLAPVVVTGVRLPTVRELARGLAGRTASLDAQDLDARGVRSLADALEQLPGVTTSDELGATAQMDVSLRGFQVSPVIGVPQGVAVYVDGVRANEPDAHEVNFDLLRLEDVERVEVVYGPSVLLGRNALGAAVNLVTRRGTNPASRELEASAGSYGRYELKAHVGARHGVWDYYLGARYEREAGWRQDTRSRIATLFGKIGLLNGTWDATLSYSGADNRIFQAGSLPESLAAARPDSNFTRGDYFTPHAHLVILNAQRLLGRTQLAINAFGRSLNSEQFNVNFVGDNSRQLNRTRIGGGAVQLSGRVHLGGRELRWLAGRGHEMSASASRGFRAPAVVEIGCADSLAACPLPFALGPDPALRPVVATTYELGWRFRAPHGRLDASTNLYRTDVRDDIFFIASSVTGGYFQNIRATRRSGFELALQWLGPAGLRLYANYGYTTATFETTARLATTRDPNGETIEPGDALPLVPNHRVNAGAALPVFTLSSGPSLRAALDARYVGRQWLRGDEANATGRLSDYAVADASLTLGWRELELRAMVRNVLDHRYFNFGTFAENPTEPGTPVQRWLTPGVPRSVQLSLSTDF